MSYGHPCRKGLGVTQSRHLDLPVIDTPYHPFPVETDRGEEGASILSACKDFDENIPDIISVRNRECLDKVGPRLASIELSGRRS